MSQEAYKKGRCHQSAYNKSREFIILIVYISALSIAIPPVLLYKGVSRDLQDTWVEDLEKKDLFYFAFTENSWTNDVYRIKWLKTVFKPYTRPKKAITKCLLIVNSYLSYVNLIFIKYISCYSIIILIFSLYLTY
jgi:hypothetical protein